MGTSPAPPWCTHWRANFLVPNATFFAEVHRVRHHHLDAWRSTSSRRSTRRCRTRQEAIRKEFADLEDAQAEARKAEADYKEQLSNAKHEAARIREEAREQGAQIVQDAREKAQVEADRIIEHAHAQIEADRKQAFASLRRDVGSLATTLAGRIVGESMDDDERQGRVVERFLADLEEAG